MNRKAALLIALLTFLAFLPSLQNGFVNWDDPSFILEIRQLRSLSLANIKSYFTSTVQRIYVPLTLLSFAIEHSLFGFNPFGFHLTNILLHVIVTLLVFRLGIYFGLSTTASALGALVFGIHPMHVESVAWITERKDLLYSVFYMIAVIYYFRYLGEIRHDCGGTGGQVFFRKRFYLFTVIFGLLSILSKPMALSLPLIFFVLDWFSGRKFTRAAFLDKAVHFVYIMPVAFITYSCHMRIPGEGILKSLNVWVWTLTFYLKKFFLPLSFVPLYRLPSAFSPEYILSWAIFISMIAALFYYRKNRWVLFSFLFFFVSIFFLLRFDNRADTSIVADRFMYLPSVGFCLLAGMVLDLVLKEMSIKKAWAKGLVMIAFGMLFMLLFAKTWSQNRIWRNSGTLWTSVLDFYPDSPDAHNNLGSHYLDRGELEQAMAEFYLTSYLKPGEKLAYYNMAEVFYRRNQLSRAIELYTKTLSLDPGYAPAYNNRGNMYLLSGLSNEAISDYSRAIALDPEYIDAFINRSTAYMLLQDDENALNDLDKVLSLDSENKTAIMKKNQFINR
ncbi:MAG: tetratricopeptide repeat protein [Candidatus Omnitrophota bacterium]